MIAPQDEVQCLTRPDASAMTDETASHPKGREFSAEGVSTA
jgi:hypothetical protein